MTGSFMQWIVEHFPFRHRDHPAPSVREASHRLRNETMALRGEVADQAGGPQNLDRLIREMQEQRH